MDSRPRGVRWWVVGIPVPQGSKRLGRAGRAGRTLILDDNPNLRAWRDVVTLLSRPQARRLGTVLRDDAVAVRLGFVLPAPTRGRARPTVKPDLDKLVRAVLDAIVDAGVIVDDAQVVELTATKDYTGRANGTTGGPAEPGVAITVAVLEAR